MRKNCKTILSAIFCVSVFSPAAFADPALDWKYQSGIPFGEGDAASVASILPTPAVVSPAKPSGSSVNMQSARSPVSARPRFLVATISGSNGSDGDCLPNGASGGGGADCGGGGVMTKSAYFVFFPILGFVVGGLLAARKRQPFSWGGAIVGVAIGLAIAALLLL